MIEDLAYVLIYVILINGGLLAAYVLVRLWYWLCGWTWVDYQD